MAHQAPLVQLVNQDPWDLLERRVLVVFVETMAPLEDKESVEQQDHQGVQETKETLERTGPRVLMVLQAQQELQAREALWVFRVREENGACQASQDQRVHQENRVPQDQLETKDHLAQSVPPVLMDLVVTLVLMVLLDLMGPQARTAFLDKGETEAILDQRVWLVLKVFPAHQVLLVHQDLLEEEERLAQEDL